MEISTGSEWASVYLMAASHFVMLVASLAAHKVHRNVWSAMFVVTSLLVIALGFVARRLNYHVLESSQTAAPIGSWEIVMNANIGLATAGMFFLSTLCMLGVFLARKQRTERGHAGFG